MRAAAPPSAASPPGSGALLPTMLSRLPKPPARDNASPDGSVMDVTLDADVGLPPVEGCNARGPASPELNNPPSPPGNTAAAAMPAPPTVRTPKTIDVANLENPKMP